MCPPKLYSKYSTCIPTPKAEGDTLHPIWGGSDAPKLQPGHLNAAGPREKSRAARGPIPPGCPEP